MIINVFGSNVCFADSVYLSQARHTTGHCRSDMILYVRLEFRSILFYLAPKFVSSWKRQVTNDVTFLSVLNDHLAAEKGNLQAVNKLIENASRPAELTPRNKVTFCLFACTLNCALSSSVAIAVV